MDSFANDVAPGGVSKKSPDGEHGIWPALARIMIQLRTLAIGKSDVWLIVTMVALGAVLHYVDPAPFPSETSPLQLTRRSMHRILFMVPVAYAGFIYGPRAGYAALLAVVAVMMPRALYLSPSPADCVMEVLSTALVSSLILLWFSGQQQEKERRQEILSRLELARQELASQVEVIKKNEKRLASINEVCCVMGQSLELQPLLHRILDKVVEELGVEVALIFLKDESGQELELVAHKGVSEQFASSVAPLRMGEGYNGKVAKFGRPIMVENALKDPSLTIPAAVTENLQALLIVPLQSKGSTTGTLCVAQHTSRRFTPDDRELLVAIGSQVGIAIENARLYQDALTSEEKYRDLFENATEAIFVQDLEGAITDANKDCTTLTGYPRKELAGINVAQLFPAQASDTLLRVQQALLSGEPRVEPYDIQLVRKDGMEAVLSVTTRLVREGGQPKGFQHIAIDVTEQRRMRDTMNYYVRQVLTAQEEERKRIARELHDETAQSLLLILQRMDGISYRPDGDISDLPEGELDDLRTVLLKTLADLRRLTRDLRPQILDDLGLVAAVEWLAEEIDRQCGIATTVEVRGQRRPMAPEAQLLLFRIVQEALSNVRRHSGASEARVELEFGEDRVRVSVQDDGHGFKVPGSMSELASGGKLGLLGMSERARLIGGSLTIESEPGQGTRVVADLSA